MAEMADELRTDLKLYNSFYGGRERDTDILLLFLI